MEKDLKLVSGSDLRGVAVDLGSGITLGPDQARSAAYAFAEFLKKRTGQSSPLVALGRDPRLTGEALLHAAAEGLCAAGARAVDFGLCATPAMFEAVLALPSDGAIMITASHLPFERNGMKFVTKDGGLEHEEVADLARAMQPVAPCAVGDLPKVDFLAQYAARLADFVRARAGRGDKPLAGRKIAVDAGNGSGGFFAKLVLEPLGADTAGSQFLEPDGRFPNHIPNPEDGAAMEAACRMVRDSGADAGVILDADCDRAAIVGKGGAPMNRNRLLALLAAIVLEEHPGATIVTDSVTSAGLTRFIERKGGVHLRYKRGYKNVIDKAKELCAQGVDCPLAVETSGHCAFADNHFLDDGAYMAARLLALLADGEDLEGKIADLEEPAEEAEVRLKIAAEDFRAAGEAVLQRVRAGISQRPDWGANRDYEGVRATVRLPGGGEGLILVRLSVHDPVLPINFESDAPGGVKILAQQLLEQIQGAQGVDLAPLAALAAP